MALIVAAHNEESVIGAKVANALALDWPRERLELGRLLRTAARTRRSPARAPPARTSCSISRRVGKVRAQDAGVAAATGELLVFSDANSRWEPDAVSELVARVRRPRRRLRLRAGHFLQAGTGAGADNQEGLYWRYEMAVRALESRLASVTAGNGGITPCAAAPTS